MMTLYGLTEKEVEDLVVSRGFPKFRAVQILGWMYQKQALIWDEMKNLPKDLKEKLAVDYLLGSLELVETKKAPETFTAKYLFKTQDGHLLESVLISNKDRETVCVSTQLGCKMGCAFCASGKGKFIRNLTAGEIVEQVARIMHSVEDKITNVVFMGMGEPLDNLEETIKAVRILIEPWGFGMSARRVTVSTVGLTPKILEFVKSVDGRVRLSVSLHTSINQVREELVPVNKKYPLKELVSALRKVNRDLKREVTFEYTLIEHVNDSNEEAEGVSRIAKPLHAKVNVIPYNPIAEFPHEAPSQESLEFFCRALEDKGVRAMLRQTAGREINSACGQLRLDRMSNR